MARKLIGTFTAWDADRNPHKILRFQDTHVSGKFGGGVSSVEGNQSLETEDGDPVNRLGKGEYEILLPDSTTVIVTSDDPNAP